MQLLNNKYKLTGQKERNIYTAVDTINNQEVIICTYKAIAPSDWNLGKVINEELRKLKLNNEITDFFYRDDKKLNKKIFYKVNLPNRDKSNENSDNIPANTVPKIKPRKNLILIPVCGTCNTPLNLRNMDPTRNKAYCKKCHRERTIFMMEPKHSIKETLKKPSSIDAVIKKDKFLVKLPSSKGKLMVILSMMIILLPVLSIIFTGEINFSGPLGVVSVITLFFLFLSSLIPRKYIEIKDNKLIIAHKPFGLSSPLKIRLNKLEQLYVKKFGHKELDDEADYSDKNNYFSQYALKAILEGNNHILLLKTRNPKLASYLEYQIEEYLKIQDKIVPFEYDIDNDLSYYGENDSE